ncbi:SRPBCC family protein [Gordonia sp. (in: high G+C Gram-positive bacteria)]|uniref:SRPBCC family protein n=1 Tax=unclassified Gordonia (in: high G+C Gram-positive bacteria) TaxID=2657482 RepID=UPI0026070B7E|nr:SRPBCC family protein [Gordonia sp. (in: high G+C Gram-positive bacteria)]
MIRMQQVVRSPAPAPAVFDYLADFTNAVRWDPNTVRVTRLAGAGEVGTVYRVVSTFAGRSTELDYRLTDREPLALIRLRGEKKSVTAVDTIAVTAVDSGTEVCYTVEFDFHGVLGLAEPLLRPAVRSLLRAGADGLGRQLAELA